MRGTKISQYTKSDGLTCRDISSRTFEFSPARAVLPRVRRPDIGRSECCVLSEDGVCASSMPPWIGGSRESKEVAGRRVGQGGCNHANQRDQNNLENTKCEKAVILVL